MLTAGADDPAELERAANDARRQFAEQMRQRAQQRQQEREARTGEIQGLRTTDGHVDLQVLRSALSVRTTERRGPIHGVEPDVDEARREEARQRLAQRRGAAC